MSSAARIRELLHWRVAFAEREAPRGPRASDLLESIRPWWERWPERFREQVQRLQRIEAAYGYALDDAHQNGGEGYPIPALITQAGDIETYARMMYFSVRGSRLRLRFCLKEPPPEPTDEFEVTLVATADSRPLFSAIAVERLDGEYRLEVEISEALASELGSLRVSDQMPFRFILRPGHAAE